MPMGVADKGDDTVIRDALVRRPCLHDGTVVDAVHEHFVDPSVSQRTLLDEILRDLDVGSGGRERARQTEEQHALIRDSLRKIKLGGREAGMQLDTGRNGVAHSYGAGSTPGDADGGTLTADESQGAEHCVATWCWLHQQWRNACVRRVLLPR